MLELHALFSVPLFVISLPLLPTLPYLENPVSRSKAAIFCNVALGKYSFNHNPVLAKMRPGGLQLDSQISRSFGYFYDS